MKHYPRILWVIVLLTSVNLFADTFNDLNVNLTIRPNDGSGDNLGGTIIGPGVNLVVGGGTPYSWFNNVDGFEPGSPGGGTTQIFFDVAIGMIGSQSWDSCCNLMLDAPIFNAGGFIFPTNGQDFIFRTDAMIDPITFIGCTDDGCNEVFNLITKPGTLTLAFDYFDGTGLYYGDWGSFTTVPEPGTLGLLAIGIGAVPFRRYKKAFLRKSALDPR
jgi:hypothetical protein